MRAQNSRRSCERRSGRRRHIRSRSLPSTDARPRVDPRCRSTSISAREPHTLHRPRPPLIRSPLLCSSPSLWVLHGVASPSIDTISARPGDTVECRETTPSRQPGRKTFRLGRPGAIAVGTRGGGGGGGGDCYSQKVRVGTGPTASAGSNIHLGSWTSSCWAGDAYPYF